MTDLANAEYKMILQVLEEIVERLRTCTVNDPELEDVGLGNLDGLVWLQECFGIELVTEVREGA